MSGRIAVYCGSRPGVDASLHLFIQELADLFQKHDQGLVYGGGSIGLMGIIADAMIRNKGEVIGVIPKFLDERELGHKGADQLILVDSMHERKEKMAVLADRFLILPGAIGTMDEFYEILTWKQLGLHDKPIAVFNFNGYYDHLIAQMDQMIRMGFMDDSVLKLFKIFSSLDELEEDFIKA